MNGNLIVSFFQKFQDRAQILTAVFIALALVLGGTLGYTVTLTDKPVIVLIGTLGLLVFLAAVLSAQFGLLILLFLTYTRFSDVAIQYEHAPSVAKFFVFLLGVAILLRWAIFHETPSGWRSLVIFSGLYIFMASLSLFYAPDVSLVSQALSDLIKDVTIAIMIVTLLKSQVELRRAIWALLWAGIFMGTLSVIQYLTGTFTNNYGGFAQAPFLQVVGDVQGYRISGPIGDPNFYAQAMVVLVPLAIERFLDEREVKYRLLALWALVVCFLTVIFTFSRGGFLALCVALAVWFFIHPPRGLYLALAIVLAIAVIAFIPQNYVNRLMTLQQIFPSSTNGFYTQDQSIQGRASENLTSIAMFLDHPLLGVGYFNYELYYLQYAEQIGLAPDASARAAHNLYLQVLAETGLLGLTAFLTLLWAAIKGALDSFRKFKSSNRKELVSMTVAIGAGFAGYLAAAVFVHAAYPRYLWLIIGVVFSLPNIVKAELSKNYQTV